MKRRIWVLSILCSLGMSSCFGEPEQTLPDTTPSGDTATGVDTRASDTSTASDSGTDEGTDASPDTGFGFDTSNWPAACRPELVVDVCPAGSSPRVETAVITVCNETGLDDLVLSDGTITGQCLSAGDCTVYCELSDPCACGVAVLTKELIQCSECANTACGNGICEEGETSSNPCHTDCRPNCEPDTNRCNGDNIQTCQLNGFWEQPRACPTDLRCRVDDHGDAFCGAPCTFGETKCSNLRRVIVECNDVGEFVVAGTCGEDTSCQLSPNASHECLPFCEQGSFICGFNDTSILGCTPAGFRDIVKACSSGETCQEDSLGELNCLPPCTPGETSCRADTLAERTCGTNGRWESFVDCGTGESCEIDASGCE